MSVPPLSVPIEIVVTGKIFPCPTGASLREVVDAIRDDSLLIGGHLERNGVAVIGGSITDEGIYRFVGGEVRSIAKGTGLCDNIYQLSFKYNRGTTTESFKTPILFEDLRDAVQDKWDIFTISDFEMHTEKGKICITPDNCQQLISSDMTILVSSLSVGFSDMKKEDVMAYAGISVLYEKDHSKFADYVFNTSSASILENEVNYIFHDLTRRVNAFSNALRSETTMREFISPFLISAVLIVGNIDFYCERSLRGSRANGAVDYVAIYRAFIICVTEAKKLEIEKGVSQNIAQMKASRESFQVHEATKRHKKRNFKEVINEAAYLHELPSTGIISTGEQWQFLRYEFIEERWNVFSSDILEISLSEFRDEANEVHLKKSITNILLKIAGLLDFQKQKCDNAPVTKKNKVDETPNY